MFYRARFKSWSLTIFIALSLTSTPFAAPKKKPQPVVPPPAEAQLRVWKGDFASKRAVQISLRTQGRKGPATELDSADGFYFAEYSGVPSGACIIEVTDASEPKLKLASLSAQLAPDSFSTLLLQERKDVVTAEILDDRAVSPDSCELLVRNFLPSVATLQVDAGDDVHLKINSPDAFLEIRGLPRKKVEVKTSGTDLAGKTFQWSNEVDFAHFRRATIVLHPDTYGRIRPRVTIDGQFAKPPAAKAKKNPP